MASSSTEISKDHPSTGRPGLRKSDSSTNARSILRSPKGGSKQTSPVSSNVSVKWNEESVKRTLHPRDKDYGLMKVSEPKTPFIYEEAKKKSPVSAEVLAQRIEALHNQTLNAAQAQHENDANISEAGRAREKVKKGECEEQAEDEVAQEEAEKLAKAQEEEAKQKTAEARAKAGAAAMARAVAAAAAKAASTVAESDKKK
ncbi:hypothetical protein HPB51_005593 [Rhipicephalus microplus]|uniref:Uncharacterized protein n=1 Tax=Rhipicephalus microplus TaxID=6941 RepID=A0A9J6DZG6_RHIMP|nr:hypothetical protein HPB51_005593 [Rhipicephalus microplus]